MTEAEWLECDDPQLMLTFVDAKPGKRRLRLFACACCRDAWSVFTDERSRTAVEVAELFADGQARQGDLNAARRMADAAVEEARGTATGEATAETAAAWAASLANAGPGRTAMVAQATAKLVAASVGRGAGYDVQAARLRDIVGTPFRPASLGPACRPHQVLALAQAVYEEREMPSGQLDPTRLSILADALEDAGCTDEPILSHLRSPGPHVRGCWAIDLILGRN